MNTGRWPIFGINLVSAADFVRFWDALYDDEGYDETFYRDNIGRPPEPKAYEWFKWKNGTPLSVRKQQTVQAILSNGGPVGPDADAGALQSYLGQTGGVVWRVFWLHLHHPQHFPIYDQHVHRAMACVTNRPKREIPIHGPTKVRAYLEEYRPFFDRFAGCERRQVDRALWSFGKFLTTKYGRQMLPDARPTLD
jgi:hypothetical protein